MGFMAEIKATQAYNKQRKGQDDEARKLYEEAVAGGLQNPRYILAYAVLLIRAGEFQKAKDLLVANQKLPTLDEDQKRQLYMDYAVCCYKLGDLEKAIHHLERIHRTTPASLIYETLGYLYVVKYDRANTPDFPPEEEPAETEAPETAEAGEAPAGTAEAPAEEPEAPKLSPKEAWEKGIADAKAFMQEALDYDDTDSILLDNMAQFLYRVEGDKAAAKPWFEKAIAEKPSQIDTLWFLSRYDLEEGHNDAAVEKLTKCADGRFSALNIVTKAQVEEEIKRIKAL